MTRPKKPAVSWPLGSLSPSKPGRHFIQPQHGLPPSDKVCNASSKEPLRITSMASARPGADDHKKFHSFATWGTST